MRPEEPTTALTESVLPFADVRMLGFGPVAAVSDVYAILDEWTRVLPAEFLPLSASAGRVLAASITSRVNVPGFARAAMDGYAVRASDTGPPRSLALVGQSLPGKPFGGNVQAGQCVRIMTGAPLPAGADAVVMVEQTGRSDDTVLIRQTIVPGKNVGRVGEDVAAGREVLAAGRRLRPQDVGLLASIGCAAVSVVRRPHVAVVVTGDELLPLGSMPEGYRIVDSNSPMLDALVRRDGGECLPVRRASDRYDAVRDAIAAASQEADVVLVSGGTSVGTEDHAPGAVAELGQLLVHGVALRPARPTGIGAVGEMPVILLPGNPVSCLCAYDLFAGRVIRLLGGRPFDLPYRRLTAPLAAELQSALGRVDYVRVRSVAGRVEVIASGGASSLSSAVTADGFLLVAADRDRVRPGEAVEVHLYD